MEGYERVLGERHFRTGDAKSTMTLLLWDMYELDGDMSKLEAAREIAAKQVQYARQAHMRPDAEWALANYARILTALGQFEPAEAQLLEAEARLADATVPIKNEGEFRRCTRTVTEAFIELYDARHAAEPNAGHDAEAQEWRRRLDELSRDEQKRGDS